MLKRSACRTSAFGLAERFLAAVVSSRGAGVGSNSSSASNS